MSFFNNYKPNQTKLPELKNQNFESQTTNKKKKKTTKPNSKTHITKSELEEEKITQLNLQNPNFKILPSFPDNLYILFHGYFFSWYIFTELAHWAISVIEWRCPSVCLYVCLWQFKTPTSRCPGDFWSKGISLICLWWHNFFFFFFFLRFWWFFLLLLTF